MPDREMPAAFCNPSAFVVDDQVAIALIADIQVRKAIDRGEFNDLPGSGEPLDLPENYDPDWWIRNALKHEQFTALLPSSIQIRKDDAALDALLDELPGENAVRHEVEDFNERVMRARYDLRPGPPMITQLRDVEATVVAWNRRKEKRRRQAREREDAASDLERAQEEAKRDDRRRNRHLRHERIARRLRRWWHVG